MSHTDDASRRTGLRWHLRRETNSLHEAADALGGAHDLGTLAGYRGFLRAHARALPALEAACDAAGLATLLPDWPRRRRAAALAADLAALRVAPPPSPPLAFAGLEEALGAAYVLEGSRLGNALLLRGVVTEARGAVAYLSHDPGAGGWPAFLGLLEKALPGPENWPQAARGARLAFEHFLAALRRERTAEPMLHA